MSKYRIIFRTQNYCIDMKLLILLMLTVNLTILLAERHSTY